MQRQILRPEKVQFSFHRTEWGEAAAVYGAWSVLADGCQVLRRRVTFVFGKAISGMLLVKIQHHSVASDFRQHACRGDGIAAGVTLNQRGLGVGEPSDSKPVHKDVLRSRL